MIQRIILEIRDYRAENTLCSYFQQEVVRDGMRIVHLSGVLAVITIIEVLLITEQVGIITQLIHLCDQLLLVLDATIQLVGSRKFTLWLIGKLGYVIQGAFKP